MENFLALLEMVVKLKPASSKGIYIRSVSLSTAMGPGVKVDPLALRGI
jgi:large subunit ribosomal protein L1